MTKVFYDKKTGKIKGISDGPVSMELPYIETKEIPLVFSNYKVEKGKLIAIKNSFTDQEWSEAVK